MLAAEVARGAASVAGTGTASPWSYADFAGLAELRASARAHDPEALEAVARQFQGVFLKMMLKSMRDALPGDPLFDGESTRLYRDLFDHQISLELSRSENLGIAEMLVRQLRPLWSGEAAASRPPQRTLMRQMMRLI